MEKHYVEKILEIFENEKKEVYFFEGNYTKQLVDLFNLDKCNIQTLRAIRDAVTFRIDLLKEKEENGGIRDWYSKIIGYITSFIDNIIWDRGGEV